MYGFETWKKETNPWKYTPLFKHQQGLSLIFTRQILFTLLTCKIETTVEPEFEMLFSISNSNTVVIKDEKAGQNSVCY